MLQMTSSKSTLAVEAPAKVNLTLRVVGRRADGFHDLESVVVATNLCDRLVMAPAEDLSLTCQGPDCHGADIPTGDENLVMKAARLLCQSRQVRMGAEISLTKSIPAGRGFGGGSSDAAATLAGLNVLWGLNLARGELAELGARIGSDVPLFFGPPVSVVRGRGEHITPAAARPRWWLTLAWPDYGHSTADVYAAYDRMPCDGDRLPAATEILNHMDGPAAKVAAFLVNDLEPAARSLRSDGPDVRAVLEGAGARAVGMTGSGSAYFAIADTETQAEVLASAARAAGAGAVVVRLLNAGRNPGGNIP
jgi:4-diphosphocytidyl-2-C-methyl-D-erythritol kinase